MACSHPIETYTNARHIYKGVSNWKQSFACGRCSSCIKKQRSEWRVRAYYESLNCLNFGPDSFILFDTLTYSDEHIKRYKDVFPDLDIPDELNYPCFSRSDVQKFFKLLRSRLERDGYDVDGNLRYILTSEYGTSVKTRGFENTHRPHYHLLFFVTFFIDPVVFSKYVSSCWLCGKTDGVKPDCSECPVKKFCNGYCIYKSKQYVLSERVIRNNSVANCIKCVNYVTKYISKDMYFYNTLSSNANTLLDFLFGSKNESVFISRFYRKFRSQVLPFHLQSIGFGKSALDIPDLKSYMVQFNQIKMPSGDSSGVYSISLPKYYQRKLYYKFVKVDNRVHWFLTSFGLDTKLSQLDKNIRSFMNDYYSFNPFISIDKLYDLALYNCVYKGTLASKKSLCLPYKEFYRLRLISHSLNEVPLYYNFNTCMDNLTVGKFLSTSYYVDENGEVIYKHKQSHRGFLPYDGYFIVNDSLNVFWFGFDKRLIEFKKYKCSVAFNRDVLHWFDDYQIDRYKQLGYLD